VLSFRQNNQFSFWSADAKGLLYSTDKERRFGKVNAVRSLVLLEFLENGLFDPLQLVAVLALDFLQQ
jgi:hypothetical protein